MIWVKRISKQSSNIDLDEKREREGMIKKKDDKRNIISQILDTQNLTHKWTRVDGIVIRWSVTRNGILYRGEGVPDKLPVKSWGFAILGGKV